MSGYTGGCHCGAIRYEVTAEPLRAQICHCDDCRRSGGSAFATNVFFDAETFRITKGAAREFHWLADSGSRRGRGFCTDCGTTIYATNEKRPQMIAVRIGSLDDASFVKPWAHVWVSRALASTNLDDDLEKFDKQGT